MQKLFSRMKRTIVLSLVLSMSASVSMAQQFPYEINPETGMIPCITMQDDAALRAKYPEMGTLDGFETWLQEKIAHRADQEALRSDPVLTIPVVVHLIHNGEQVGVSPNHTQATVQAQIEVLNQDFRRMMGTPGFNTNPAGADIEIEFCLAYIGPDGRQLTERGINRVNRNDVGIRAYPYTKDYINDTIKAFTLWDPEQYFNIWVVGNITGETSGGQQIGGYAQFPSNSTLSGINNNGGPATSDGIVILGSQFGGGGTGRTATHEAGHFFGLRHTSGDPPYVNGVPTGGCDMDDFCADTPNSFQQNFGCPPSGLFSCGSFDMIENYMDYTSGSCQNVFTNDQKIRMRTVLLNASRRANLPNSTVCEAPTAPPVAAFAVDSSAGCNGTYQFFDTSSPIATNWIWIFGDGQTFNEKNPTVTFTAPGTYSLTLIVNNELGTGIPVNANITVGFTGSLNLGISSNVTIQPGGFTQLTATGGTSYTWFPTTGLNNSNVANPICQPAVTTIYTVTATNAAGCTGTTSVIVFVAGTIGVENLLQEEALIHPPFPNPVHETVTFSGAFETGGELGLHLLDLTGRRMGELYRDQIGKGEFTFTWQRRTDLPAGIYFVEWSMNGRKLMQKIWLN